MQYEGPTHPEDLMNPDLLSESILASSVPLIVVRRCSSVARTTRICGLSWRNIALTLIDARPGLSSGFGLSRLSHMKRVYSRTIASLLPLICLLSADALQKCPFPTITRFEYSSDTPDSSPEAGCTSVQGLMPESISSEPDQPSPVPTSFDTQDASVGRAPQKDDSSEAQQQEKKTKEKEKRGSIVAAPIPIASPAIGSGVVLAGGYIFPLRKSDKVSQPSTIGGAFLITDNGSRGGGLGGDFYFKQNTYHVTTIYFRGNINYDFYGIGTSDGDAGRKLPLRQTGEIFLGDFLHRLGWHISAGPRFLTGNSTITLRSSNDNGVPPPSDTGLETRLTALGFHVNRDTRPNRFYPTSGTLFDFSGMFFSDALGSKYSFESYRFMFNYYHSLGKKQVLAYNLYTCATAGDPPFYGQCIYGTNSELRGYVAGQYIDRDMIATQVEYRRSLPWRFGVVVFGGLGEVAPSVEDFRGDNILPAIGGGLRFKVSTKYNLNFRADLAQGKDGHTFSMGIGEAF